jgi:hypothetical protein
MLATPSGKAAETPDGRSDKNDGNDEDGDVYGDVSAC